MTDLSAQQQVEADSAAFEGTRVQINDANVVIEASALTATEKEAVHAALARAAGVAQGAQEAAQSWLTTNYPPTPTPTPTPSALAISTASLPGGVVGSTYSATLEASGGTPPYSWSQGGLPYTLSLDAAGAISGTVTSAAGDYTTAVTVTDAAGNTATKSLPLVVTGSTPTPTPSPTPSPSGSVVPYGNIPSPSGNAWATPTFDDEFDGTTLASHWAPNWFGDGTVLAKFEANGKRLRWQGPAEEFEEVAANGSFGGSMNNVHTWAKNVSVANGVCTLALPDASDGALISTNPNGGAGGGGFTFTGGYAEARCNFPGSGGTIDNWPAFWCDGQSWPTDGELDVVEGLGGSAAYHFHDPSGGPGSSVSGDYTGWHVYGALWIPGQSVEYFYDGKSVGKITSGITNAPLYLICNIGSGNYGGPVVAPSAIEIDYVRVWALP